MSVYILVLALVSNHYGSTGSTVNVNVETLAFNTEKSCVRALNRKRAELAAKYHRVDGSCQLKIIGGPGD